MKLENRKAKYNYEFLDTENAGIILEGCEVKSIRQGKATLNEASYIFIDDDNGVWLKNFRVEEYENGGYTKQDPDRDKKLLLTKKQIKKWKKRMELERLTIVPVKMFFDKSNKLKVHVALAKGKKQFEKRETIKKRESDRNIKNYEYGY